MRKFRPNALSLAVAIAISSSIIVTQALADRRLQTKSIDITDNGPVEFTRSESIVRPTLGDDQQPIPGSFTTTYSYQAQVSAGYVIPAKGFTDILSDFCGGVSSVDLFETDENDVARKYIKVLKVGDEEVFRFTHNLEEKELIIEVRSGMTDRDSVEAVRSQLAGMESLEPLTKIASHTQLFWLLEGAEERAGNLGKSDHYVSLATIEVDKVEVNGRTFMRLISGGDQPPELQRLGQSLFVNDEALLAAATSAYIQVHILRENIQQQALNELLAYSKPVGYVVHVKDDKQVYPVPAGYPMLKVEEAPGEVIVFYGQMQNPHDIAFVESLHKHWEEDKSSNSAPALTTHVKKYKLESYLYIIRSRQMEMLEEFTGRLDAAADTDQPTTLSNEDKLTMRALAFYESLRQALTSAIPHGADEFEFTLEHIRVVSSVITPIWMHNQLVKHFSFKPVFRNLLINPHFVQNIQKVIPVISHINKLQIDTSREDGEFASKVMSDMMNRQLSEFNNDLERLRVKEAKLVELNEKLLYATEQAEETKAIAVRSHEEKLRDRQRYENSLALLSVELKDLENQNQKIRDAVHRIPSQVKQVLGARTDAKIAHNAQMAGDFATNNQDDSLLPQDQDELPGRKLLENIIALTKLPGAKPPDREIFKAILAFPEGLPGITPVNENDLVARFQSTQQQPEEDADSPVGQELPVVGQIGRSPVNEADLEARQKAIQQHSGEKAQVARQHPQQRSFRTDTTREAEIKSHHATIAARLHIWNFDNNADVFVQHERLIQKINTINDKKGRLRQQLEAINAQQEQPPQRVQRSRDARTSSKSNTEEDLTVTLGVELNDNTTPEELDAVEVAINMTLFELERLKEIMDRTLAPKTRPEILSTLTSVEKILEDDRLSYEDDVYLHRQIISEDLQKYIINAKERLEKNALIILEGSEKLFNIDINEGDDKAARLERIHKRLDGDDISADDLDEMDKIIWSDYSTAWEDLRGRDFRLETIHQCLRSEVEVSEERVKNEQAHYLSAIERALEINPRRSVAAIEKSKAFTTKLANDMQVEFEKDVSLNEQKRILVSRAWALLYEVLGTYEDESVKRDRNNEIAHQLNIEGYEDHAAIDDQIRLIRHKLLRFGTEIYEAGQLDVNGRVKAIEDELDRQMAPLGPKPRFALDRELAEARRALQEAESEQKTANKKLNDIRRIQLAIWQSLADLMAVPDDGAEGELALTRKKYNHVTKFLREYDGKSTQQAHALLEEAVAQENLEAVPDTTEKAVGLKPEPADTSTQQVDALRNKQAQPGGHDASKIQQLIQEECRLEGEIEVRKADIERMKDVLIAAEEAVKNDDGPFQCTPRQAKVLDAIHTFTQQHSLKKQALEAAIGLAELAVESGEDIPDFTTFDFDEEFAPVHLRALVGDTLTFDQANRIVTVFKSLKTTFPAPAFESVENQPSNVLRNIQQLMYRARDELQSGAKQYDDEILGMGKTAIHYVDYEPGNLNSFSEYLAARYASGNKIIALLREGLISKVELQNYIKAIRGVAGYQTVDEFEHFLGYRYGVNVIHFSAVVDMLSDKGAEEFMENAFTPVTVTATGPAGMKESVVGMKEYAAAVIANYVLDDIAFENGRKTAAFLTNIQDTLTPYANTAGISESDLIKVIHDTLMRAHAAAIERQLNDYWIKPSAFLVQAVTWYYSSYKPLLVTQTAMEAANLSLSNTAFLYLLDLTSRGDYTHRMLTPFQHWLERYGFDLDRTGQYAYHSGIEKVTEVGGLAMPLGKAASSVILLRTGSMLFARQYNANPHMYRSISRLVPEMLKSMATGHGVQVPLLHRITPEKVKILASATAGLVLGPVATVGA
ncbi:hypothetical protein, partial [Endozoicomonas sp. SESOKO3]|uniref:hypothetical protein n=1 Tax=Endozoicomonas sp. SESOKO3 TaxID=2828744 RepID=UPI0021480540